MVHVADDILFSFSLSHDEKKNYDTVVEKFERHFVRKSDVIFECAKFNQCKQEEGESVDDFVTALYCLLEHCQYGELCDEMICDKIVIALRDSSLSEKLQLEAELTLDKAVTSARQRESVKKQQKVVRAEDTSSTMDALLFCGKKDKPVVSRWPVSKQFHKMNAQIYVIGVETFTCWQTAVPSLRSDMSKVLQMWSFSSCMSYKNSESCLSRGLR